MTTKVPSLKIDSVLYGDRHLPPRRKIEKRIVWGLIRHLDEAGFKIHSVFDGDDETLTSDPVAAMESIFNLDEASFRFQKKGYDWHGVLLVAGNGIDMISDWNYNINDNDGFNAAMEAFDSEVYV